ncbi:FAR1-related sequence 5-like protein [Tanacetum coccineum]
MDENHFIDVIKVYKHIDLNKDIIEEENELESDGDDDLPEVTDPDNDAQEITISLKTPRATLYEHNETPGGSIYWDPHVQGIPIPVEGTYFDTLDEAIDMYTKYAEMGGFEVKKSGERTIDDFKNHQRDINVFIENSELVVMFWADDVSKCNYKEFEDIVSFDATFNSNKKCVTLGSGILLHEDTESYTWLLKAFMSALLKEPTKIVTYQDGAMKRAIEAVFTKAKHRLCMWHITQKIPSKICKEIYDETDFKDRLTKIIWNMFMEPLKFKEKWAKLIEDFAYFIDSSLFGLMRTTSRSESENSFFKSFTIPGSTLVNFMMSYELAMERQRYRQEALDFKTIDAAPKCETKLAITVQVYTRTIFLLVQKEIIEGCWSCTYKI